MPQTLRRHASGLILVFVGVLSLIARPVRGSDSDGDSNELERMPVTLDEAIHIAVEVFGETHTFFVDTGTTHTVLDAEFRERLGTGQGKLNVRTPSEPRTIDAFAPPEMKIGAASTQSFQPSTFIACIDLNNVRQASGINFRGVIGMDFLQSRVLRINPDEGFASLQRQPLEKSAHVESIRFHSKLPHLLMNISDSGYQSMMIDTGSLDVLSLRSKEFDSLLNRKRIVLRTSHQTAHAGGESINRAGVIDQVAVGPYRLHNVLVKESRLASTIGLGFLERFDTELDFANRRAYLRPSRRLHQRDRLNLAGIFFERSGGSTKVHSVEPGGVADQAGVRQGDIIAGVNGRPASDYALSQLRELRSAGDTELSLSLERDGKKIVVALKLNDEPDPFPATAEAPVIRQIPE